ncbi:MAG: glycoside hydrolase [Thermosynechococcaceae cyanobacterium]
MSHPLYVAFIWHQHQPLYKSRVTGDYRMPWVRLHGTKDYLDLVLLLERYPKLHQTVNLVPSLIAQIEDYVAGTAQDPYLTASLQGAENLSREQKVFILGHFFDAHHQTLIDPHPRYAELYNQHQEQGQDGCLEHWGSQDYSDLMAWHNLAWIDPLFGDDPDIAKWLEKGCNFSRSDRKDIIAKHREILSRILPQHRKMQESGQLEVITSPYTHPILPLLADTQSGRVAVPQMELPNTPFQWPNDIPRHLKRAWDQYTDRFGRTPRGLWPSEQSVSPQMLPYVAKQGFQWLCSDEAVLGWTKHHFFHRDESGNVCEPEILYQPYRLATEQGDLSIVFRDHRLSDLVGFTYSAMDPQAAASDLIGHLDAIASTLKARQPEGGTALEKPWLVTIALDGENCWEFYPKDGLPFLESLYGQLCDRNDLRLVTVSEYLDKFPVRETLPAQKLHSGSWVDGSFTTWIGDPIKNRAWDLLTEARQTLAYHPEATEEANPEAWEALFAAEGSDWFWWFGEGHSSNHDAMFDQLFREHLTALYQALNEPVPEVLQYPLEDHQPMLDHQPQGFIHPHIDGVADEQDWEHAGRITVAGARGTMHKSSTVQRLWYGLDHLNFYLRFDCQIGKKLGVDSPPELHLLWYYPGQTMHNSAVPLSKIPDAAPLNYLFHHHLKIDLRQGDIWLQVAGGEQPWYKVSHQVQVGLDQCLELAVPWHDLHVEPDWQIELLAVLAKDNEFVEYLPENSLIPLQVP